MKKSIIVAVVMTFFLFFAESNAEMKIEPGGITTTDNAGSLRLSGNVTGLDHNGAIISSINNNSTFGYAGFFRVGIGRAIYAYTDGDYSWGVYARGDGTNGRGVYGSSNATEGHGVHGFASGTNGIAVYGEASGGVGRGLYGKASGSSGAAVYGEASNEGDVTNKGGSFAAYGKTGIGVYAVTTGSSSRGVKSTATGASSMAFHGVAANEDSNASNYGGKFEAYGGKGIGVHGIAHNTGEVENYGGKFEAHGEEGIGVYGIATKQGLTTNYGVYGKAEGFAGYGVYGTTTVDHGTGVCGVAGGLTAWGVRGIATSDFGTGVYGAGGKKAYDFYADGEGTNYGSFTGAHDAKFSEELDAQILPGMIVSVTGKTEIRRQKDGEISLSATLPTVTLSAKPKDKAVMGAVVFEGPLPREHWYASEPGERFGAINALGEGRVWVSNINGPIEPGDYITTSSIPGYGQMQDDDLLHSYTLGKAIETVDWDNVTETVEYGGNLYKVYLIAVFYTSG